MEIIKIVHQTWKDKNIPPQTEKYVNLVKKYTPGYEYKFWTDEDIEEFIEDHPLKPLYDMLSPRIKQIDLFKYLVVYEHGGLFIDLDIELFRDPTPILRNPISIGSTAIFYSQPKQEEWLKVFEEIYARIECPILWSTGPKMLLEVMKPYLLPAHYFFPFGWSQLKEYQWQEVKGLFKDSWGCHHMMKSWDNQESNTL